MAGWRSTGEQKTPLEPTLNKRREKVLHDVEPRNAVGGKWVEGPAGVANEPSTHLSVLVVT
jgi:hypothetical protein